MLYLFFIYSTGISRPRRLVLGFSNTILTSSFFSHIGVIQDKGRGIIEARSSSAICFINMPFRAWSLYGADWAHDVDGRLTLV